jgi:hypothetical protein
VTSDTANGNEALEADADALFGTSFGSFVEARNRLVEVRKQSGDREGAKLLAALHRPSLSAWAVNQLYRQARGDLDALFDAAARVQRGDRDAMAVHRDLVARLRAKAGEILVADGNAAAEPTLRKVAATLQALAASGGFAPDAPGRLVADRDPPGFEALAGLVGAEPPPPPPAPKPARTRKTAADKQAEAEQKAREKIEREHAAARKKLTTAVALAGRDVDTAERKLAAAREAIEKAGADAAAARERMAKAEAELAAFDEAAS